MIRPAPGRAAGEAALAMACALVLGCGGEPAPADGTDDGAPRTTPAEAGSIVSAAPEEIRWELENLAYEIADLESLVEAGAETAPGTDPAARLVEARVAYEESLDAVERGETDRARERLAAAAGHVESVKRGLGLAEEWGDSFGAESIPVTVPENLGS